MKKNSVSYKEAGVDIDKSTKLLKNVKDKIKTTYREGVLTEIGNFGGLFSLFKKKYKEPVLVSSIDGVGTKIKIASMMNKYNTVGIDIVAHCCNDILVHGAEPLFFMDYIGTSSLSEKAFSEILEGLIIGCKQGGCALIGGETAEMPGVYEKKEYDLVGSIVGIIEKSKIIDGSTIKAGDQVIALPSNGLHTNGYSLARHILFNNKKYEITAKPKGLTKSLGETLLAPHTCYSQTILPLLHKYTIKGMAHITGGGIFDNIPRILPSSVNVKIKKGSWEILPIFDLLVAEGNLDEKEAFRTFNMGIGLILIVSSNDVEDIILELGKKAKLVGEVVSGEKKVLLS